MGNISVNSMARTEANTVLIVDDDPVNRKVLGKIFSVYYQVEEAENGREGLNRLLAAPGDYCAVLLDVIMPELSGIDVVRYLNAAEQSTDVMKEAYRLGVMDVIRKPVVSYVVLRRVQSVIELFEARKHLSAVVEHQSIELLAQAEQIIQLNQGLIEALATAFEFRNEESGGHVQRISGITRVILENTGFGGGLSKEEIDNITMASIMHDVGKITIPDAVLTKPGRLTAEEYEVMKSHTVKGVTILESIPPLKNTGIYDTP